MLFAGQDLTESERKKGKMAVDTKDDTEGDPEGELFHNFYVLTPD